MALGCAVHHLHVLRNPWGCTGMGQVFTFAHAGRWNTAQVGMLHRIRTTCDPLFLSPKGTTQTHRY